MHRKIDPAGLAAFWAEALGWRQTHAEEDEVVLEPPEGSLEEGIAPDPVFLKVPDTTTAGFPEPRIESATSPQA